jgi:hypothetical protein
MWQHHKIEKKKTMPVRPKKDFSPPINLDE